MNFNTQVTLQSHHGRFVVAEQDTRALCNRDRAGEWETFTMTSPHGKYTLNYGDKVNLRSHHHKFLCAEQNLTIVANRDQAGPWEEFTLVDPFNLYNNGPVYPGQRIALRTHHNRYVCAEPSGALVGNRDTVGEWERFVINQGNQGHHHHGHHHHQTQQQVFVNVTQYGGGNMVNYQDTIKIKHVQTGNVLHSHKLNYRHNGGSGQQQVTCYHGRDSNDFFKIVGIQGYETGPVPCGMPVNIVHVGTGLYLHSHHGLPSPSTGQQEVTCYHGIDQNNHWVIAPVGFNQGPLQAGSVIQITHKATGKRLHSHPNKFDLGNGDQQQEVTCHGASNDANDNWRISEIQGRFHQE
jgi:dolichyl-phosphate-mannose--protein O-mannosyl transferase